MQPHHQQPNFNPYPPSQPIFDKHGRPINPQINQFPQPYPPQKIHYAPPNLVYYPPAQPNNNAYIYTNANNQINNNGNILQNENSGIKPKPIQPETNPPGSSPNYAGKAGNDPNVILPKEKEKNNSPYVNKQNNQSPIPSPVYVYNQQYYQPQMGQPQPQFSGQSPPQAIGQPQPQNISPHPQAMGQPQPQIYAQPQAMGQPQPQIYGQPQVFGRPQGLAQIFGQPQAFGQYQPQPYFKPQNAGQNQYFDQTISFGGPREVRANVEKPKIIVKGPEENILRSGLKRTKSISDLENEEEKVSFIVNEVLPEKKLMETANFFKNSNLSEIEKKNYEEKFLALEKQLQIVRQQVVYWKQKFESSLKNEEEGLVRSGLKRSGAGGVEEILRLKEFLVGKNNECEEWKTKCEVLEKQLNESNKEVLESKNLELEHTVSSLNNDLSNLNDLYQQQLKEYNSFREEYTKIEDSLKNQGMLKDDLLKLSKVLNSKIQEAEEWKSRADKKEDELKERSANTNETEKRLQLLMNEVDKLSNVLKIKMEENIKMSQLINTMQGKNYELNSWKEKHHALSDEVDRLNQVVKEKTTIIEDMSSKFRELVGKVRNDEMRNSQFLEEMKKTMVNN